MGFNDAAVRKHLKAFAFTDLFVEDLGWDRTNVSLPLEVAGHLYALHSPVHKAGLHVFLCPPAAGGSVPDYNTRRRIEHQVAKTFAEHLIIFTDAAKKLQVWQWMKREKDQPIRSREQTWYPTVQGPLVQKLQKLQFTLDEEERGVGIVDSTGKTRDAFDVEKVTKKFFKAFETEHGAFLDKITGFPPPAPKKNGKKGETESHPDVQWYTSLTLNRLMFVYFIQKKRFLDNDIDYLQNRLKAVREKKGSDKFHSFYRIFLLHLFHEGLGKQKDERDTELAKLIGNVPYLNGGFFEVHQLERTYPEIDIPDKAFKRLFAFFDGWDWVLDTRAPRDPADTNERKDEINPDVIGYIFEKYINQKQMGAYYTKEDITGYITQNTVLPFILDSAAKACAVAFQPEGSVWKLLKEDPDRYIYEPVRRGVIDDKGKVIPLPPEIEAGIADMPKRAGWNKPAPAPFALPTETWREHVARRQRCLELREKLKNGEVHAVNDLITHNLDIRQFVQDIITNADGSELLRAIWQPLQSVTILDPTCGSGAFLFAALQLLKPLYDGCVDKMQALLDEADRLNDLKRLARLDDFKKTLDGIHKHVNEDYFVLKSIIVNNLYGVDIMEEAVEICRLRLFLKLVSTVSEAKAIEPLPDIDFNVRAGNTLVGYATKAQSQDNLNFGGAIERIDFNAAVFDGMFRAFQARQLSSTNDTKPEDNRRFKAELLAPLAKLREELDSLLAVAYGQAGADQLPAFRKSHQPFHWWIEFYGIMKNGGFDVIVGNPPYAEIPENLTRTLLCQSFVTALPKWSRDEDLYVLVTERSVFSLLCGVGRFGMILPLSIAFSTKRPFELLRKILQEHGMDWWWSHFDRIPSALFGNEVRTRCTVALHGGRTSSASDNFTTSLLRWTAVERDSLFTNLHFAKLRARPVASIAKVSSNIQAEALAKLQLRDQPLGKTSFTGVSFSELAAACPDFPKHCVFVGGTAYNWFPAWREIPKTTNEDGRASLPARTVGFQFSTNAQADAVFALLCSSLGYWWWAVASDGFNLKRWLIDRFPVTPELMEETDRQKLASLGEKLKKELKANYVYKDNKGRIGNFYLPACQSVINEIDAFLADHVPGLSSAFFDDVSAFNQSFSRAQPDDDSDED